MTTDAYAIDDPRAGGRRGRRPGGHGRADPAPLWRRVAGDLPRDDRAPQADLWHPERSVSDGRAGDGSARCGPGQPDAHRRQGAGGQQRLLWRSGWATMARAYGLDVRHGRGAPGPAPRSRGRPPARWPPSPDIQAVVVVHLETSTGVLNPAARDRRCRPRVRACRSSSMPCRPWAGCRCRWTSGASTSASRSSTSAWPARRAWRRSRSASAPGSRWSARAVGPTAGT